MSKFIAIFALCVNLALGSAPKFEHSALFTLAKDEKAYVHFREKGKEEWENFEFSWTLYDGLNLIIHSKFRKYPRQITLSLRQPLRLYKQSVLPPNSKPFVSEVWLYLDFERFENAKAQISAYIVDKTGRVEVEFTPKKEE